MKSSRPMRTGFAWVLASLCLIVCAAALGAQNAAPPYRVALPGYHYSFPHDHFNHPDFQTEWWYYTGNVKTADGHRFGFELTFFRLGVDRTQSKTAWDVHDLYLAHLALSDLDGAHFYHTERVNRAGPGLAGADEKTARVWNGNWQVQWKSGDQQLQAVADEFALHFALHSEKPPVIQGEDGVSQKAAGAGHASYYISLTRLDTNGSIDLNGKSYEISGSTWMDHEFFTHQLAPDQVGWDWLGIQLADRTELMLFDIRRMDGSIDPFSSGTYIDAEGKTTHLRKEDFVLQPLSDTWKSSATGAVYPIRWKLSIPKLSIDLGISTPLPTQELSGHSEFSPTYWEGAITLSGTRSAQPLSGVGYLEMTGYDHPVRLNP